MEDKIDSNRFIDINIDSDTEDTHKDHNNNNFNKFKEEKKFFNFKTKSSNGSKQPSVDLRNLRIDSEDDEETVEEVESEEDELNKTVKIINTSITDEFSLKSVMNSSTLSVSQSPMLSLDESEIAESSAVSWNGLENIDQDELLEEIERTLNETKKMPLFRSSSACLPKTPKAKPQHKSLSNKTSVNSSMRNESLVEGLLGDIYDRFNITLKDNMESDVFTEMSFSSSRFSGIDSNADHESECRKSFKLPKSSLQNLGFLNKKLFFL